MRNIDWATFKAFVVARGLSIQWIQSGDVYLMCAADGFFALACDLRTDESNADTLDFVTNFKAIGNKRVSPSDSDGSSIVRQKTTRTGWHYEPRSLDFITSKYGSLYNRKHTGNTIEDSPDYGDAILTFWDASGVQLVKGGAESDAEFQTRLDASCVRTHADWQATYDMEIIGATVSVLNPPTGADRAYAWVIVAPDIPAAFGGSVPFMAGGWNLRFFTLDQTTFLDGRGVKAFPYDPVYNSNKIRTVVKHLAGAKIELQFVAEHFRA